MKDTFLDIYFRVFTIDSLEKVVIDYHPYNGWTYRSDIPIKIYTSGDINTIASIKPRSIM